MQELQALVVVDSDARSREVLAYGFSRAGFAVHATGDADEALMMANSGAAGLVIASLPRGGEAPGSLLRTLKRAGKGNSAAARVPVVVVGEAERRDEALAAGVAEFIARPAFLRDIIVVGGLAAARGATNVVEGRLEECNAYFLARALATARRTARVLLERSTPRGRRLAELHFTDGELTDARVGRQRGSNAWLLQLLWGAGRVSVDFGQPLPGESRTRRIQRPTDRLLEDGPRFAEEFRDLAARVGGPSAVYQHDETRIELVRAQIPREVREFLPRFDGTRTIADLVEDSPFPPFDTLVITHRLVDMQAIQRLADRPAEVRQAKQAVTAWLQGGAAGIAPSTRPVVAQSARRVEPKRAVPPPRPPPTRAAPVAAKVASSDVATLASAAAAQVAELPAAVSIVAIPVAAAVLDTVSVPSPVTEILPAAVAAEAPAIVAPPEASVAEIVVVAAHAAAVTSVVSVAEAESEAPSAASREEAAVAKSPARVVAKKLRQEVFGVDGDAKPKVAGERTSRIRKATTAGIGAGIGERTGELTGRTRLAPPPNAEAEAVPKAITVEKTEIFQKLEAEKIGLPAPIAGAPHEAGGAPIQAADSAPLMSAAAADPAPRTPSKTPPPMPSPVATVLPVAASTAPVSTAAHPATAAIPVAAAVASSTESAASTAPAGPSSLAPASSARRPPPTPTVAFPLPAASTTPAASSHESQVAAQVVSSARAQRAAPVAPANAVDTQRIPRVAIEHPVELHDMQRLAEMTRPFRRGESGRVPKVDFDPIDEEFFARESEIHRVERIENFDDLDAPDDDSTYAGNGLNRQPDERTDGWFFFGRRGLRRPDDE